jgi:hypothetical protein
MNSKEVLGYLSIKHSGDWVKVYNSIKAKESISTAEVEQVISECKNNFITILDEEYPEFLKNIYRPPLVLFYKGDISLLKEKRLLAVVGTREPSSYGVFATEKIISELDKNIVIVSGLARGIDATAHKYAMNNGLKTVAFLGCGINYIYPAENFKLYKDIEEIAIPGTDELITAMRSEPDAGRREMLLKKYDDGRLYKLLQERYFPAHRMACCSGIYYRNKPDSTAVALNRIVDELIYNPSPDYNKLLGELEQYKDDPRVLNLRGIVEYRLHHRHAAEKAFEKAAKMGNEQAMINLQIIEHNKDIETGR